MRGRILVNVFGDFSVTNSEGEQARFRTKRASEVVARLVLQDSRRMIREELASEIWPDAERSVRLGNLRPALTYARQALGAQSALSQDGEMIALSLDVRSDWEEAELLEGNAQAALGDDHLLALFSLHEALRKPLLRGWESEWIEPFRTYYARRQVAVLRQIAEAFASKGDWLNSLEFGRKLADVEPYDESGIRVKLRCLGALGRLGEAQSEYALFTKQLSADLGLRASVPLRRMADTVISGRFHEAGTGPVGSQAELIWQILSVMVEEAPEQVLPLLGSPKLNWFIALSGPELKSLLEKVFQQTSGWDPNRRGIVKRLLQIYLQNLESDRTIELANELLAHGDPLDQIAALNYLGMAHNDKGNVKLGYTYLSEAVSVSQSQGHSYFEAVSIANLGVLRISQLDLDDTLEVLESTMNALGKSADPNARFGLTQIKSCFAMGAWLAGRPDVARASIQEWHEYGWTHGTAAHDTIGKAIYALITASDAGKSGSSALLAAVHTAMAERSLAAQLGALPSMVACLRSVISEADASTIAGMVECVFSSNRLTLHPAARRLLRPSSYSAGDGAPSPTAFETLMKIRTMALRSG